VSRSLFAGFCSRLGVLDGAEPGMRKVVSVVEEGFASNRCERVGEAVAEV
jgi:hypothetical protein